MRPCCAFLLHLQVFNRWWLVYELTGKLHCKPAYRLLNKHLWSDGKLRSALLTAQLVAPCASPYPSEVVRKFKMLASTRLTAHYADLTRDLSKTISVVKRIQDQKRQMLAALLSVFIAACVGIANFFSRLMWAALSSDLGYGPATTAGTGASAAVGSSRALAGDGPWQGAADASAFVGQGVVAGAAIVVAVGAVEAVLRTELAKVNKELANMQAELDQLSRAIVPVCDRISGQDGGLVVDTGDARYGGAT